ncbi:ABC transporter ATP-binding protein [Lysinibacillus sp. ZYM-1]|uniref:ABC transporter ATP-binding protein n=1 Tax=Lysinibacillus sp. ZYM-1 TaxID=1681184 RepID=UPI0006CEA78F|nr:ABC transporter ATP-binding protein [Lysinibacillus sp. ZYM-1]KPN95161.1 ABC transporter ATP-binding protein [Lysinibacillus sp. ZYM-1]
MTTILEVQNVCKQYNGKIILKNASFSIAANQIIALVGKNGSGKSTLLKIIAAFIQPDSGTIVKHRSSLKVGYVPEVTPSHILFTPQEYLYHLGRIRGMTKKHLLQKIEELLDMFQLKEAQNTRIVHFSKGMKQKVMIMQAMLEETDLLIMDEPLSGLDAKAQNDFEQILAKVRDQGLSIILTCHETKLLENLVDSVLLIQDNQIIQEKELDSYPMHRLIFEIASLSLLDEISPFMEIQQKRSLVNGHYEIVTIVQAKDSDQILLKLLQKNASIKYLATVNYKKEQLSSLF